MPATMLNVDTLLQDMVRLNTVNSIVSGDPKPEAKMVDFLEDLARGADWRCERLPVAGRSDQLLVTLEVISGAPWVLFESHMDTVTVEGMSIEPFAARIEGGRIWGRGACDTKGTGAAMLAAMQRCAGESDRRNNVGIVFAIDEEYGMTGVRSFIKRDYPRLGIRPRVVIVGEPTMCRPVVAHNGAVRWKVSTAGVAAHSANPSRGRSAISDMVPVIQAMESTYVPSLQAAHPLTGKAQCSINMIRGGVQINTVPDCCEIRIDRRVVPGEDPDSVLPAVEALLEAVRRVRPGLIVTQELLFSCPPLCPEVSQDALPVVQQALASLKLPTEPVGVPYATDGGDLGAAGIPAIVIGPGDIAQAHTKDEWLELEQLHQGVEVYHALMQAGW